MVRCILILLIGAVSALACPTPGGTGTTDGGLITYHCIPANMATACTAGAMYSYSSQNQNSMVGEPPRCMDLYYNTADGPSNTNDTIVFIASGGNTADGGNGTHDWGSGFELGNGTAPAVIYALVDGTAISGKHFNWIDIQHSLSGLSTLHANINAGDTSFQLDSSTGWWPQAQPYTVTIDTEQMCVTASNATYAGPWTVTVTRACNGTTAASHTSGAYAFAADSSFVSSAYPTSSCDLSVLLSYLATKMGSTIPGRKDRIFLTGLSNGAYLVNMAALIGKSLLPSCTSEWSDTSWTIQSVYTMSSKPDMGAVAMLVYTGANSPSPYNAGDDGSEPKTATATTGPGTTGQAPSASTMTLTAPYAASGIPTTGANATYTTAHVWSPQFCMKLNFSLCGSAVDSYNPFISMMIGALDNDVGAVQQITFGATAPGTQYAVLSSSGHILDLITSTASGTAGTCSGSGGACLYSQAINGLIALLNRVTGSPNVRSTWAGVNAAGVY